MNKISKFTPFLILVFFVAIIGVSTYKINVKQQNNSQDSASLFSKEDILLPEFSLPNLYDENDSFSKEELLGKYSVINFFASWCTTCRAEHEALMNLQSEGIVDIYGVAWRDISINTREYLEQEGNPFNKVALDSKAIFTKITGLKAVPETIIVNPEGRIILRYQGNLEGAAIYEIKRILRNVSQ